MRGWWLVGWAGTAVALGLAARPGGAQEEERPGMVRVPAGPFTMGSEGKAIDEDGAEKPPHEVTLPAYWIDRTEVTCADYAVFLNAAGGDDEARRQWVVITPAFGLELDDQGRWRPKAGLERHPMTWVTWYGAQAYARWAGKRLPTEAEWEKAARGTDGRKFPWGNDFAPARFWLGQDRMHPVGEKPDGASPYGCLDMAGNAWEWTSSLFKPYPYDPTDGREDPDAAGRRVARGGSWVGEPYIAHASYRFRPEPTFAHGYLGFRCAAD